MIKKGLNGYKIKLKKLYNINYALAEIVRIKNKTYYGTKGETPNALLYKELTDEEIKKINNKMLYSQKYSNIFKNTYSINEKVLINENFKINNKTLKKIGKNFGQWNITT